MLKKYVISGDIIELYEYSHYVFGTGGANRTDLSSTDIEQSLKNYANTNQRRRDNVRRMACANFDVKYSKFVTLTFADNITDVKKANYIFMNFIKRLKYKFNGLKYLAVIEFQDRGAVHYHMLCNLPYITNDELSKIWGQGFIYITAISHVDNVGAYMVKYMCKNSSDMRLRGFKGYLFSRNLKVPEVIVNHNYKDFDKLEARLLEKYDLKNVQPSFCSLFDTEILGTCVYTQYNLKRK